MRFITVILTVALSLAAPGHALAADKIKSLCEISYPSDSRIPWDCKELAWSDTPQKLFGAYWRDVLRFNRLDRRHFLGGLSIKVPKDLALVKDFNPLPPTYQEASQHPKFILVDQSETFLGAYAYGRLVYSFPAAVGVEGYRVPNGTFRIDAADRRHKSNLYEIDELGRPYPMHYALRFFVDKSEETWPSYWIHGRDLPGYPVSHGCIGLYDEEMQHEYYAEYDRKVYKELYQELTKPFLNDAQTLYQWVVDEKNDPGTFHKIENGPPVLITGRPPL